MSVVAKRRLELAPCENSGRFFIFEKFDFLYLVAALRKASVETSDTPELPLA